MKMKITYQILLIILYCLPAQAQICGVVKDQQTNSPLGGAEVILIKSHLGAVTDKDGYFCIKPNLPIDLTDTLVVSFVGYADVRLVLSHFKNNSLIYLTPKNLLLEQISIYGERVEMSRQELPHQIEQISGDDIQRLGSQEIADLFKKIPAVRIEGNDLDGRRLQIRGSNPGEVNVYFDGVLINNLSQDNSADLSIIPTENIEKLELLKGGNFTLLGNGAFGGVLNVVSKKDMQPALIVKAKIGNLAARQYNGYVNIPLFSRLYVNYSGQFGQIKPQIEYFPGERFSTKTKSDFIETEKQHHALSLDYYSPLGQFNGKFFIYRLDYKKPSWQNQRDNLLYAFSFSGSGDLHLSLSRLDSHDKVRRYSVDSTQYLSDFQSARLNAKVAKKFSFRRSSLQLVSEYFHDELQDASRLDDLNGQRVYYDAFLYDNRGSLSAVWSFEDRHEKIENLDWRIYFGARADVSASGNRDFSPSWGAQLNLSKNDFRLSPYLSYGKNVRYPTLLESAYLRDLFILSSSDTIPQKLQPEYNHSFEVGLPVTRQLQFGMELNGTLAFFNNTSYNKILRRPYGETLAQSQTGRNTTRGVDASLKLQKIFGQIDLGASYTYLDISNRLLYEYKPQKSLSVQCDYVSFFGLYLSLLYFYEGKSYAWYFDSANELQTRKINPTWDGDASLGWRFHISRLEFNLQVAGHNVFDNGGYDYYYLRKRSLMTSLSVKY